MYATRDSQSRGDARPEVRTNDIRACLIAINVLREGEQLDSHESLFERGLIDSLGISTLIAHLESKYGIKVPEYDLLPDNFDSVNAIAEYVNSRLHNTNTD